MKTNPAHCAYVLSVILALGLSACATDDSAPAAAQPQAAMAPAAAGVNTVKVLVDTDKPGSTVTVNGLRIGYTPAELHIQTSPEGTLIYAVNISIQNGAGSGGGSASAKYSVGEKIPAKITFNGTFKNESRDSAKFDTKPIQPNVQRE